MDGDGCALLPRVSKAISHLTALYLCVCVWVYQYMANVDFKPTFRDKKKPIYTAFSQLPETWTKLQAT